MERFNKRPGKDSLFSEEGDELPFIFAVSERTLGLLCEIWYSGVSRNAVRLYFEAVLHKVFPGAEDRIQIKAQEPRNTAENQVCNLNLRICNPDVVECA